jgi:hypothetical protein
VVKESAFFNVIIERRCPNLKLAGHVKRTLIASVSVLITADLQLHSLAYIFFPRMQQSVHGHLAAVLTGFCMGVKPGR